MKNSQDWINKIDKQYEEYFKKEQPKMTREEAVKIASKAYGAPMSTSGSIIDVLAALGLLKFDEPKKEQIRKIFELDNERIDLPNGYVKGVADRYGIIRLEQWPEGLVLWVGGEIKWKSWVNPVPDLIVIEARKYIDDCRVKPYSKEEAFSIIGEHFKMLEKLLKYVENK
jgi:hypothetical protein